MKVTKENKIIIGIMIILVISAVFFIGFQVKKIGEQEQIRIWNDIND